MARELRARGLLYYKKPPLTLDELVQRLVSRGLTVNSYERAVRYLGQIGYYRLSPYMIPFQVPGSDHKFQPQTSFEEILKLYLFDKSLRLLMTDALERIEVAVRATITDYMSTTYQDSHWYTRDVHFKNLQGHHRLLSMIETRCEEQLRQKPERKSGNILYPSALEHYLTTYAQPKLPPSWLTMEMLTIGQLSRLFSNLRQRSDKTAIAKKLGVTAPVLESWLETYVRVRNICAHHGRLWNVGLGVYPKIPKSSAIRWVETPVLATERLYPVLISVQTMMYTISPRSLWARRLNDLLAHAPSIALSGMGMPQEWASDSFWAQVLNLEN
ncbi:Abi family protein [Rothia aerolata]|uniref:Peptide ABC transporter substrate-binding protein n=1 Tax=Rothia aerolata TaxID=1812262 RepID=A0A917IZ37_9MICC|nr:Abi family protein [Rothia aerolata]GGH66077.1 peptide ABC transporter substrate-binding protein [Rothia aerolata]